MNPWNGTATLVNSLVVPQNLKHRATRGPSNFTPRYMPKRLKICIHTKTCTQVFIIASFIMSPKWKQLNCPSSDEKINKMWYTRTVDYFLVMKKNGDFSGGPGPKTPNSQGRGPHFNPCQRTKSLHASMKMEVPEYRNHPCSQINK